MCLADLSGSGDAIRARIMRGGRKAMTTRRGTMMAMTSWTIVNPSPAMATSVAGMATLSLWTTLWSFLGLLVLPSLSRRAVGGAARQNARVRDSLPARGQAGGVI